MPIRFLVPALLGACAALLVSCGSTGSGLIPATNAGPLQSDFEAVAKAAQAGNGSCAATEAALGKTEQDFLALPATVDRGLHARLEQGIANLHSRALAMCAQPNASATQTTATTQTTTAPEHTTQTSTETTTTATTPTTTATTPATPTPPVQGGGTEAPGEGSEGGEGKGQGKGDGQGKGQSGEATSAGGASPGGER